jgi:hypothetical protein
MNDLRVREEESLIRLQQNDPTITKVTIKHRRGLNVELDDNNAWFNIDNGRGLMFNNGNFDLLLHFIETSQSLQTFSLLSFLHFSDIHTIARVLLAVSKSSSIKYLRLSSVTVTADSLENLFNHTRSLTKLSMKWIIIEGAFIAPSRKSSIEELELVSGFNESPLIQVLEYVRPNSNIKRLSIFCRLIMPADMSVSLSRSIQQFLEASTSVQRIEFEMFTFQALSFGPIATAIKSSHDLLDLNFNRCSFDSESTELLKHAVKQNWSVKRVNFEESYIDDDDNEDFLTTIQLYCVRNRTVPQLIADPGAVPASLWPKILESELNYEHKYDVLFKSLMALGDEVGQQKSLKRSPT